MKTPGTGNRILNADLATLRPGRRNQVEDERAGFFGGCSLSQATVAWTCCASG